jgi:hypothetical protein
MKKLLFLLFAGMILFAACSAEEEEFQLQRRAGNEQLTSDDELDVPEDEKPYTPQSVEYKPEPDALQNEELNTPQSGISAGLQEIAPAQTTIPRGNTVGNIVNRGFAAVQGDWIYYCNSTFFSTSLDRVRTDGTQKTQLLDDFIMYLNVMDDWIYFSTEEGLYKVRTDGTERALIVNDWAGDVSVIGDWIYYRNRSDSSKLYKIRTDGSQRIKLNDDFSESINVVGDWIYYSVPTNGIYKIRTDGTERTKLSDDSSAQLIVADDWIYYLTTKFENGIFVERGIFKICTNGTQKTQLVDDFVMCLNVIDDWIYFFTYIYDEDWSIVEQGIFKIHIDGTRRTRIFEIARYDFPIYAINIISDWIYYSQENFPGMSRVRTDGTGHESVT